MLATRAAGATLLITAAVTYALLCDELLALTLSALGVALFTLAYVLGNRR